MNIKVTAFTESKKLYYMFLYYINIMLFFFSVVNVQWTVCHQAKLYMDLKNMKR